MTMVAKQKNDSTKAGEKSMEKGGKPSWLTAVCAPVSMLKNNNARSLKTSVRRYVQDNKKSFYNAP